MASMEFHNQIPPKLPGSYMIRDAVGDIRYWGDSDDLYLTWCEKAISGIFSGGDMFEYQLTENGKVRTIGICHMSDTKQERK